MHHRGSASPKFHYFVLDKDRNHGVLPDKHKKWVVSWELQFLSEIVVFRVLIPCKENGTLSYFRPSVSIGSVRDASPVSPLIPPIDQYICNLSRPI
jgi:hypothetical protein